MNPNSGQRGMNRPFFVPTLMPMDGSMAASLQQVVMTSGGGIEAPIFTTAMGQSMTMPAVSLQSLPTEHAPHTQPIAMTIQSQKPQRSIPKADLYLCKISDNASVPSKEEEADDKGKASLNDLEQSFKDLDSHKIKDTLSSFLPHIPGEFDRTPDTMLRQLLEQRTIGGKDFSPLSGQALLGFRLLPGPLPEVYRMDPPSLDSKPHHKKRKHKHKNIEKGEEGSEAGPPSSKIKLPTDAYTFVNMSSSSPHISHAPSHASSHSHSYMTTVTMGGGSVGGMTKQHQPAKAILEMAGHSNFQPILAIPNIAAAPSPLVPGGMVIDPRLTAFPGKRPKKEKKKNREKKKNKEKKKKKHHSQDPLGPGPSSILPHQPTSYNQFPNP